MQEKTRQMNWFWKSQSMYMMANRDKQENIRNHSVQMDREATEMGSSVLIPAAVDKPGVCVHCLDVADGAVQRPWSAMTEYSSQKIGKFGNERMLQ